MRRDAMVIDDDDGGNVTGDDDDDGNDDYGYFCLKLVTPLPATGAYFADLTFGNDGYRGLYRGRTVYMWNVTYEIT